MENTIYSRGADSILVKWVKGHASAKDIEEGRSSDTYREGNNMADNLADLGVLEHVSGLLQISAYYAAKQRRYKSLVRRIHCMFLRVLKKDRELRSVQKEQLSTFKTIILGTDADLITLPCSYIGPKWNYEVGVKLDMQPISHHMYKPSTEAFFLCVFGFS